MSKRWSDKEQNFLNELRLNLESELKEANQVPDVIGDRRLLRFSKGHNFNLPIVTKMLKNHYKWRKEAKADEARYRILYENINEPSKFPYADKILKHVKQVCITWKGRDKEGSPISVEKYGFSPSEVLADVSIEQYLEFMVYALEYKILITEQLAEHLERINIEKNIEKNDKDNDIPYGVIIYTTVIRDLDGIGFEHLGVQGQEIISAILKVSTDNYPELMKKCYMINTPWLFNTLWFFIKNLLSQRSIDKVEVLGTDYLNNMTKLITKENIPNIIEDGTLEPDGPFDFDLSCFCFNNNNNKNIDNNKEEKINVFLNLN